ncbi:MAG: choice-of-anchor Q domain-containing protein [Thermoanaerobaculia bacterium]
MTQRNLSTAPILFLTLAALALLSVPLLAQPAPTVLTVGPAGTYATIQAAIDAAVVGQDTHILVQGLETYTENLSIPASFTSGNILVWGGWNDSFTIPNDDSEETVVDGDGDRVLDVSIGGGSFEMRNFALTNGVAEQGAGILVIPAGNSTVTLEGLLVAENTATSATTALGGGLWASLSGTQQLTISDCDFYLNQAVSTGGGLANAGGLGVVAAGDSRFVIEVTDFAENHIESSGAAISGGGILLGIEDTAEGDLFDVIVSGNTGDSGFGDVQGTGGWWATSDSAVLRVERLGCVFNAGVGTDAGPQILSSHSGQSTLRMSETGIAQGELDGLSLQASESSTVNLVNLTVADHVGTGLDLMKVGGTATLTLYNTIAYGNGVDFSDSGTGVATGSNLIGVDPPFVDPTNLDYHLMPGSPAFDAGDNSPPGGLGSADFDGRPRIADGTVDIGIFEGLIVILIDGFESGDTSAWTRTSP